MDRYYRWRRVFGTPLWAVDQHWYVMLGNLYLRNAEQIEVVVQGGLFYGEVPD